MITCEDNLLLLKRLPDNHINLVYSDILFGTSKNFGDFQDLPADKKIIDAFYIPRIIEMRRVLKEDGQIYLHMDWRISHWIRCIMDDVFGYQNFRNEIIWHYNSAPRKKGTFGSRHDTILRYSKSNIFTFNEDTVREPYSLTAPRGYAKEKYYNKNGKVISDVWQLNILGQNDKTERVGYQTQKPESLIKRIVESSSNLNDLCADFFMGCGTMPVVCKKLGRNFIGCDINPRAVMLTEKRLGKI